mmetsp:Transcript_12489/g.52542  ORF Transcript_12489/g.52542 Transcript_12489/m.52542 type:complete len:267 (-) Transcript_12489:478-1278(-)
MRHRPRLVKQRRRLSIQPPHPRFQLSLRMRQRRWSHLRSIRRQARLMLSQRRHPRMAGPLRRCPSATPSTRKSAALSVQPSIPTEWRAALAGGSSLSSRCLRLRLRWPRQRLRTVRSTSTKASLVRRREPARLRPVPQRSRRRWRRSSSSATLTSSCVLRLRASAMMRWPSAPPRRRRRLRPPELRRVRTLTRRWKTWLCASARRRRKCLAFRQSLQSSALMRTSSSPTSTSSLRQMQATAPMRAWTAQLMCTPARPRTRLASPRR